MQNLQVGRPSQEGRGLKQVIEPYLIKNLSRPSQEGRGLKHDVEHAMKYDRGRPSQEGRGLKLQFLPELFQSQESPLARGAWIETSYLLHK